MNISDIRNSHSEMIKLKIGFVGKYPVGKTSIINKFVYGQITSDYQMTGGVDFITKTTEAYNENFRLQLWDTSGQECFRPKCTRYLRGSSAILLVYDVSFRESFLSVLDWQEEVQMADTEGMVKILVGNKTDLANGRQVSFKEGFERANELGFAFFETSAKSGENVNSLFYFIISELIEQSDTTGLSMQAENTRIQIKKPKRFNCNS